MYDVTRHQKATSNRKSITLGSEKTLLWQMEEFASMCSKEYLWETVAEEEAETPLETETQGGQQSCGEDFGIRDLDGMVIDEKEKV